MFSLDAQVCENFDDMNLKEELLRGIYAYGFEKPSAIQQRAIVPCIKVPTYRIHNYRTVPLRLVARIWEIDENLDSNQLLTTVPINSTLLYIGRGIIILLREKPLRGPFQGVLHENRDF